MPCISAMVCHVIAVHCIVSDADATGPIVRISPHELSVADISASRAIYKVGGSFLKSEWYNAFTANQKVHNLFSMTDSYQHGHHRRLLAHNYSERWVSNLEPYIQRNVKLAISRMADEARERGFCDVFKWFTFMVSIATPQADANPTNVTKATDVIGEASFGESFRMLETGKVRSV